MFMHSNRHGSIIKTSEQCDESLIESGLSQVTNLEIWQQVIVTLLTLHVLGRNGVGFGVQRNANGRYPRGRIHAALHML